ncbi:MAG: hypothetical protein HY429_03065 [Candidatus Levybacteria bacterium]|nr:hypothetical protein [Candidatus Levybacteria bacterium]
MDTPEQQTRQSVSNPPIENAPPQRHFSFFSLKSLLILLVAAIFAFSGTYYIANRNTQVACTQDAKQCPDGSYVSRIGPKCEFATCPTVQPTIDPTANWKTYTNTKHGFMLKLPSELIILQQEEGEDGLIMQWANIPREKIKILELSVTPGSNPHYAAGLYTITVSINNNLYYQSLDSKFRIKITKDNLEFLLGNSALEEVKKLLFDNRPAIRLEVLTGSGLQLDELGVYIVYKILDNNRVVSIDANSGNENKFDVSYIDRILQTFKFLDQP